MLDTSIKHHVSSITYQGHASRVPHIARPPSDDLEAEPRIYVGRAGIVRVHVKRYMFSAGGFEAPQRLDHQGRAQAAPAPGRMRADLHNPGVVADDEADRLLAIARQQRHLGVKASVAGGPLDPLLGGAPNWEARPLAKGFLVGFVELPSQRGRPFR